MGYPPQGVELQTLLTITQAALAALQVVPVDSSENTTINQLFGNRNDGHSAVTLFSHIHDAWEDEHHVQRVYPTLADCILVTANAAIWTLGNYTEIVPANTIEGEFHIHHICLCDPSKDGNYEIVLYAGTTELGRVTFSRTAKKDNIEGMDIVTPHCAANTQIQAKLATGMNTADTVKIKIWYHVHS